MVAATFTVAALIVVAGLWFVEFGGAVCRG